MTRLKFRLLSLGLICALLMAGCGVIDDGVSSKPADTAPAGQESTEQEESSAAEDTEQVVSSEAETEAPVTEAPETDSSEIPAETTVTQDSGEEMTDFSGLAGYWYIDGDPNTASIHIAQDGSFTAYYASGSVEATGNIRRVLMEDINNYVYVMTLDSGEHYLEFADDGEKVKTDIYIGEEGFPHLVRLCDDGGLADDGREQGEEFFGEWYCYRCRIYIGSNEKGLYAHIEWSDSAAAYVTWDYPLVYEDGKLVCDKNGEKNYVEYESDSVVSKTTLMAGACSAVFELRDGKLFWDDQTEHMADDMLFTSMAEPLY